MNTNKKRLIIAIVILIGAVGNFLRMPGHETIRAVEFITIFAIGALSAVIIRELVTISNRKNTEIR